jgi:hypothetical protein
MGNEVLQSPWFWPLIFVIVAIYYGWVLFYYFRGGLKNTLKVMDRVRTGSGKTVSLKWEELVLGFELHRRLIGNPLTQLDPDEKSLLEKSPYRELILQTISK